MIFNVVHKAYLVIKDIAYAMLMDVVHLFCLGHITWLRPYLIAITLKHSAKDGILITLSCIMCDVMEPSVYDTDQLYEASIKIAQMLDRLYSSTFIKYWTRDAFAKRYGLYRSTFNYTTEDKIDTLRLALDADITFNDIDLISLKKVISEDIDKNDKLKLIDDALSSSKTKDYILSTLECWAKMLSK